MQSRPKLHHNTLKGRQYSLSDMTCQITVWNKVHFCDLLHQTLTKAIMMDYNATVAFNSVLHNNTVITCCRLGMPMVACKFLHTLLHRMEFYITTGLSMSEKSFLNKVEPKKPTPRHIYNIYKSINTITIDF